MQNAGSVPNHMNIISLGDAIQHVGQFTQLSLCIADVVQL